MNSGITPRDLLKRYQVLYRIANETHVTYLVEDVLQERIKKLTVLRPRKYPKEHLAHLQNLFPLFNRQGIASMEFLFDWGFLENGACYLIRDARTVTSLQYQPCPPDNLIYLTFDLLIALYNIHRNRMYYGRFHPGCVYSSVRRDARGRDVTYILSGISQPAKNETQVPGGTQKMDLRNLSCLLYTILAKDLPRPVPEEKIAELSATVSANAHGAFLSNFLASLHAAEYPAYHYLLQIIDYARTRPGISHETMSQHFLNPMFPMLSAYRKDCNVDSEDIATATIFQGEAGAGKSSLLFHLAQHFRRRGYMPLFITREQHQRGIRWHHSLNYLAQALQTEGLMPQQDSLAPQRADRFIYALNLLHDRLRPVFLIDDLDLMPPSVSHLVSLLLQSHCLVYATSTSKDISLPSLENAATPYDIKALDQCVDKQQACCQMLRCALPFFHEQQVGELLQIVHRYGDISLRGMHETISYLYSQLHTAISDIERLKRQLVKAVTRTSDTAAKWTSLDAACKEILLLVCLLPTHPDNVAAILTKQAGVSDRSLETLISSGFITIEDNTVLPSTKELAGKVIKTAGHKPLQECHKRIARFLLKQAKISGKYQPLLIAKHLYRAGKRNQAMAFYLKGAEQAEQSFNTREAIRAYKMAYSFYAHSDERTPLLDTGKKLFSLYLQHGDHTQATRLLAKLQKEGLAPSAFLYMNAKLQVRKGKLKQAIELYNRAAALIKDSQDLEKRIEIHADTARLLITLGRFNRAEQLIRENMTVQKEQGMLQHRAELLNLLGGVHLQFGRFKEAEACFLEAIDLDRSMRSFHEMHKLTNNLGVVYVYQNKLQRARQCYQKALSLSQRMQDISGTAMAHFNLAVIDAKRGWFENAEHNLTKARLLHTKSADYRAFTHDLVITAEIHLHKGELNRAFSLLKDALKRSREMYDKNIRALIMKDMGRLYLFLGSFEEARDAFREARALVKKVDDASLAIDIKIDCACLYYLIGAYGLAREYCRRALGQARAIGTYRCGDLRMLLATMQNPLSATGKPYQSATSSEEPEIFSAFWSHMFRLDQCLAAHIPEQAADTLAKLQATPFYHHGVFYRLLVDGYAILLGQGHVEDYSDRIRQAKDHDYNELIWFWEFAFARHLESQDKQRALALYHSSCQRIIEIAHSLEGTLGKKYTEHYLRRQVLERCK